MYIGSDEEFALTKAIDINFPASSRFLCTKHLNDGTRAFLQTKVGVPQKDRNKRCKSLCGDDGLVNADDSIEFDKRSKQILVQPSKYPKFSTYFTNKLRPCVEAYVNRPSRESGISKWTNNNAESLNHIMKLDADWKVKSTPELIEMLYQMTLLHFKDLKRALYGEGTYRLYGKYKKMSFLRSVWKRFEEAKCNQIFSDSLKIKSNPQMLVISSSLRIQPSSYRH